MTVFFKAKTKDGYTIKILAELLQNNIKTACFEIDNSGIRLCMMDNNQVILILLNLKADKFDLYKYKKPKKIFIGVNLSHLHKMLKSVKKKDRVEFFINSEEPNDLGIKVIPKENNRVSTSFVKIQNVQLLDTDIPEGYGNSIIVPSSDYQKMIKSMSSLNNDIHIKARKFEIQFKSDGDVMKRIVEFGEPDSDDESEDENSNEYSYNSVFNLQQLSRITKMSGLSPNLQIYATTGLPLYFHSDVGSIGEISIFIKSKDQIEIDKKETVDSDDEESGLLIST